MVDTFIREVRVVDCNQERWSSPSFFHPSILHHHYPTESKICLCHPRRRQPPAHYQSPAFHRFPEQLSRAGFEFNQNFFSFNCSSKKKINGKRALHVSWKAHLSHTFELSIFYNFSIYHII